MIVAFIRPSFPIDLIVRPSVAKSFFWPEDGMRSSGKFCRCRDLPSFPVECPHIFDQVLPFLVRQPQRNDEI